MFNEGERGKMNCDHLYKKFEKSFHMNINLVDLFGNQFNNSLKTIGLNFYQCRFCGKVKQKKF